MSTGFVSGRLMTLAEGVGGRREVKRVGPASAIVVLSGMLQDRQNAPLGEWSDAVDRFEGGLDLLKARKAPILIFTGGYVPWLPDARPEGEVLRERAGKLGVPKEEILVTGKVGNTAQEAEAVKELLENLEMREVGGGKRDDKQPTAKGQQHTTPVGSKQWAVGGKPRIILVTSAFHMPRAKMLFERQGFEVEPFPVDFQNSDRPRRTILSFVPSAQALVKTETAMREGVGLLYYTFIKR